jgi:hypothetical protein
MPQPTHRDVHVDAALTTVSTAYIQDAAKFVAGQVFPVVPVEHKSDKYYAFNKNDFMRDEAEERAPSSESAGSGFNVSTDDYSARTYAFHKDVDDEVRANADPAVDMDDAATAYVTQKMLMKREIVWRDNFFVTGAWSNQTTPGTLWGDPTSDPIGDISAQIETIEARTGFRPNVIVAGAQVSRALKNHPDIVDRYKYVQRGIVGTDLLAGLFEVESFLEMRAVTNQSVEGAATQTTGYIGGKHLLICYRAPAPSLMAPTAGYIFAWTGLLGAEAFGNRISRFRIDEKRSDRIEGEMSFAVKKVADDLAHFFLSAVA